MPRQLAIVKQLIRKAGSARRARRADYTGFCLAEAGALLETAQRDLDAAHARRWDEIVRACQVAYDTNSPEFGAFMAERSEFWNRRDKEREAVCAEWIRLAHAWRRLGGDEERALQCARNSTRYAWDSPPMAAYVSSMVYTSRLCAIFGSHSVQVQAAVGEIKKRFAADADVMATLDRDLAQLVGRNLAENATSCLRTAEQSARTTGDWIACAAAWFDRSHRRNAARCLRLAESAAENTEDWIACAEKRISRAGSQWSRGARRCLAGAERSAKWFFDWWTCWQFYEDMKSPGDVARCLRQAESLARQTEDWASCADGWLALAGGRWNDDTRRCLAAAERLAATPADWSRCGDGYATAGRIEEAERCLRMFDALPETATFHILHSSRRKRLAKTLEELKKNARAPAAGFFPCQSAGPVA